MTTYFVQVKDVPSMYGNVRWEDIARKRVVSTRKADGFLHQMYDYIRIHNQMAENIEGKIYEVRITEEFDTNGMYVCCDGNDFAEIYENMPLKAKG